MAIGAKSFDIDGSDFIKGISSSNYLMDGGYSPQTFGVNTTYTPGLLYGQSPAVDQTDALIGTLRASCEDPTTAASAAFYRLFVASDGTYYTWDNSTLALVHTDGTNPTKYGRADMVGFGNTYVYTTNEVGIVEWQVGTAFNDTFYVFTGANGPNVPHPALVFEDNAFYGNGNTLLRQTGIGVAPAVILTLPTNQVIVALGIDPGSGRMLISISDGLNASDAQVKVFRVGYYDGFSAKLLKVVIVDDMITCFHPVGGSLYITYGQNLGYWTGAGIQFVRALNISLTSAALAYKQHVTHIGTTLFVIENSKILAYGNIIRGQSPVPYYVFDNTPSAVETTISLITNVGSGQIGYGYVDANAVPKFFVLDTTSVSSTGGVPWRSNRYIFPRPVTFNQVVIEYGISLPTDGSTVGTLSVTNDRQVQTIIKTITNTQSNMYTIEAPWPDIQTRSIQISYTFQAQYPIRRITVFYSEKE